MFVYINLIANRKLKTHRQNVVDDKSVDADKSSTKSESENHSKKQSTTDVKKDINARKISDEYVYMDLPEQPKRQAPVVPNVSSPSKRQQSQSLKARRKAPAPPTKSRSFSEIKENTVLASGSKESSENAPAMSQNRLPNENHVAPDCQKIHISSVKVPNSLAPDLLSQVMNKAKIDERKAEKAVSCVLEGIKRSIPELAELMEKVLVNVPQVIQVQESKTFGPEDELRVILDDLSKRKDDSQQRSWALHEDYHIIQNLLTRLLKLLTDNDKEISMKLLREDDYHYLNDLVIYYQMEPRAGLRVLLIQTFGSFCQFGYEFISQLLCTVLPTELAREICQIDNITSFLNVALLLTMLFSTGETLPLHLYAQLNESFLEFIFDCIERPHIRDDYDQIPYSLVSVVLSFNQHFKDPAENKVLRVIAGRTDLAVFTEKLLLMINREDDPVSIFDYHKPNPNSVLKILQDVFALKETSNIFFTNDLKVLIDIILRQLTDRPHGDKVRTQFLSLFYDMITNSNYKEHRHRNNEFGECFTNILVDDENDIEDDKYIVRNICSEFNTLFPIFI